jgi:Protein of unknown function (DUF2974)
MAATTNQTIRIIPERYPAAQGLKFSETKGASALAYAGKTGEEYQFPDGKHWQVTNTHIDDNTAFRAIVLKPLSAGDNRRILAFGGTDLGSGLIGAARDLWTDAKQVMQYRPTQYRQAKELAAKYYGEFENDVTLTGHSLGGGMASYAALMNYMRATGVNAAPLSIYSNGLLEYIDIPDFYLEKKDGSLRGSKVFRLNIPSITQYNVPGELVSGSEIAHLGAQPGIKITITGGDVTPLLNVITNHLLNNAGPEAALPVKIK